MAQTLPQGFDDSLIAAIPSPTAIAFLPNDRILVTSQQGVLHVVSSDRSVNAALTIPSASICSNGERGLLGVAVDPDFQSNNFIYLYYTYRGAGRDCSARSATTPVNRVSRFVMSIPEYMVNPTTEQVLLDNIPSFASNHNGGDLQFGKDGFLYVSVGDSGCHYSGSGGCAGANTAARETYTLLGKILRTDRDGNPPADNPWMGADSVRCATRSGSPGQRCQETFAWGFRNPYRIAFNPDTGALYANDVGQGAWEEIDLVEPGVDYGWNAREGFCATGSLTNCITAATINGFRSPVFAYGHNTTIPGTSSFGCNSISGGAFVPKGIWGSAKDGYLFADFVCGSILQLRSEFLLSGVADLITGLGGGSLVSLAFGPYLGTTSLYYTTYARGGELHRVTAFVVANAASFVRSTAAPDSLATLFGTKLADAAITVRDSAGAERDGATSYTFETQANFFVPAETAVGDATVIARRGNEIVATTTVRVEATSPGIFAINSNGKNIANAQALHVRSSGERYGVPTYFCQTRQGCFPLPINVSEDDVFLTLYGTGIRGGSPVIVTIGSEPMEVLYAGAQPQYPGLDQINVKLPVSLAGRGEVPIVISTGGRTSPPVVIHIP